MSAMSASTPTYNQDDSEAGFERSSETPENDYLLPKEVGYARGERGSILFLFLFGSMQVTNSYSQRDVNYSSSSGFPFFYLG